MLACVVKGNAEVRLVMVQAVEQLTGVLSGVKWRSTEPGSDFCIAALEDGTTVKGNAPPDEIIPGITYRFFGQWDQPHPKYGKSFKFKAFSKSEPHSRLGMVKYLERYAPNVGPRIAGKLFDLYKSDACMILRTDPARVSREVNGMTLERAREAAAALQDIAELEDVKIELTNLFAGRGFPGVLIDQVIRRFGPLAPQRIKRDPFTLLVSDFPGAGFARCDRLYMDLGLPPGRMKRQMICLWHILRTDMEGHTWFPISAAEQKLQQHISGVRANLRKAVRLGVKSKWLAVRQDTNKLWWIADGEKALNEQTVALCVASLMRGSVVLPRFTEALEGECGDEIDANDQHADCPECHGRKFVEIENEDWEHGGTREIYCPTCMSAEARRQRGERPEQVAYRSYREGIRRQDGTHANVGGSGALETGIDEYDASELARIGRETGICQFCGRKIVHHVSLKHGYGPVCAERWGLPWEASTEVANDMRQSESPETTESAELLLTSNAM